MNKIPVIIDTDPGVDDFFAIMLANSIEAFDIKAITAVAGNLPLDITLDNVKRIATYFNIDTRIGRGAKEPMLEPLYIADYVHGENGLGGYQLPDSDKRVEEKYAWDILYEEAVAAGGELVVIALGPLTNIAIALLKYPNLKNYIKKIVLMGGTTEQGNTSIYGEFNIQVDPEAADIVFKAGIRTLMVGLNVTEKAMLLEEDMRDIIAIESEYQEITEYLLRFLDKIYDGFGVEGVIIHDALAVAAAYDETLLETIRTSVVVETAGKWCRGRTVAGLENWLQDRSSLTEVAMKVDRERFLEMLKNMAKFYC